MEFCQSEKVGTLFVFPPTSPVFFLKRHFYLQSVCLFLKVKRPLNLSIPACFRDGRILKHGAHHYNFDLLIIL